MAKPRPIQTRSYRGGVEVRRGHASTLQGAILSSMRRMLKGKIAAVEILSPRERLLATLAWAPAQIEGLKLRIKPGIRLTLAPGHRRWWNG